MHSVHKHTRWMTLLQCMLVVFMAIRALAGEGVAARDLPAVALLPSDGLNLALIEQVTPQHLIVGVTPPVHNWFAGTFTHLPLGQPVSIGLSMEGNDTRGNIAHVRKWRGLMPMFTYADPTQYASYEWFVKDRHGRWVSGDPFKQGEARYAGTGRTPVQQAIPPALADTFLTPDRRYWIPWREVETTDVLADLNIFRITQTFEAPTATIAMRIPFTYTYLQALIHTLREQQLPGVSIDEVGFSRANRPLQVIRIEDAEPNGGTPPTRTVLLTAREHGTEPASSWALVGTLHALIQETPTAKRLRRDTTWLLIPIQDPDGSVEATFDALTDIFLSSPDDGRISPEGLAYARYLTEYFHSGRNIDVTVSLHNVEANECQHVATPFVNLRNKEAVIDFNRTFFRALAAQGFRPGEPHRPWEYGFCPFRLYGWCAEQFGAFDLAFEVNDRYPTRRLSLPELQQIGEVLTTSLADWSESPQGVFMRERTMRLANLKRLERAAYLELHGISPGLRSGRDMVGRGF